MLLCSLSVAYACPYHNPSASMGHFVHSIDISKPLTHISAICLVQLKPGLISEEDTSPACQWPSKVSICPLKLVTTHWSWLRCQTAVRSRPWWGRRAHRWASLVDRLSWQRRNAHWKGCEQICAQNLRNKLFVYMEHFWDFSSWNQHFTCCIYTHTHTHLLKKKPHWFLLGGDAWKKPI